MSAHTPGPEEIHVRQEDWDRVWRDFYARTYSSVDARLTAAAPALLEALEWNARLIAAAPRMLPLLAHVPHNNMTAAHNMIGTVAGCPGCEARAILRDVEGESNG